MSKKHNKKQRDRQKRKQQKRRQKPGQRQAERDRGAKVAERAAASSLAGMKRAPPPELIPAIILAIGACIPVLTVRFYPAWPALWHVLALLGAALVFTLIARRAAKRRTPKWDPILFFGVSAFAAAVSWSGDAGEIWVLNSSDQAVRWHVDEGLETELVAGGRARLDLRRGQHKVSSAEQIVDFSLDRGERVAIVVGTRTCASVGGVQRREGLFRLKALEPAPDVCPASKRPRSPTPTAVTATGTATGAGAGSGASQGAGEPPNAADPASTGAP